MVNKERKRERERESKRERISDQENRKRETAKCVMERGSEKGRELE